MAGRSKIHVTPRGDDWAVKREHGQRATKIVENKDEAVKEAKRIAKEEQPSQVIVHRQDGTFQGESTYKKDPFPPHG